LIRKALLNKTVLVTGGGGGIGYEASRAFSYMGANVIIGEIDAAKGTKAQKLINEGWGNENADFFQIDISNVKQIDKLYEYISNKYAHVHRLRGIV